MQFCLSDERFSEIEAPLSVENVGCIVPDDCVLSAIDFHCSSIIEHLLLNDKTKAFITEYLQKNYSSDVC